MRISTLLRYLALASALILYWGSCSRKNLQVLYQSGLVPDDYRYGDLYRISNLPQFKESVAPCPVVSRDRAFKRPVHLYIIGDSFTEKQRIGLRDFPVEKYQYTHWDDVRPTIQLDKTKTNVLILETVERHFREHFARLVDNYRVVLDTNRVTSEPKPTIKGYKKWVEERSAAAVEERLEVILFSGDWALRFKELKAALTQRWFERIHARVALSPDEKHLFYILDTDTTGINSSFTPLPDQELDILVDSINRTAKRYQRLGFDRVFVSIIPNKATMLAPRMGNYNRLIERVQQHPALKVPTIDLYSLMKKSHQPLYLVGDSHWNCDGRALWIGAVQEIL